MKDFERIEKAIRYLKENFKDQPDLDRVAREVFLSPYHFNRMFHAWAGITPKKFLQYISLQHAKSLLQKEMSLSDAAFETGLSGTGRLHDLFIQMEAMTPGTYKNGGQGLAIRYGMVPSPFGELLYAATEKGLCFLQFCEDEGAGLADLKKRWPLASLSRGSSAEEDALRLFLTGSAGSSPIRLHVQGTAFQVKVWEALLSIPEGRLTTYGSLAVKLGYPNASRAVGTAIGANPVALLIPCHRLIKSSGLLGQYHWGAARKTAIIGWESGRVYGETPLVTS